MNKINEFFTLYLTETIAFILIILLILLYVIIKQRSDKPKDLKEHEKTKEEPKPIHIFSDMQKEKEDTKQTQEIKHPKEEPSVQTKPEIRIIEKKRELTSHDPITKENFNIFAGSKILVAEDNLINQKVINGILGDSGMIVEIANNGQEALDILQKDKDFSIVLMDAHMPVLDGFEATRRIRGDDSLNHVLVVALSGDTASDDIKKMYNAGMQEHLEKPLNVEKLYEVLYCYLDMKDEKSTKPAEEQNDILNIDEGIEICSGDNELYKEVLSEFMSMYKDSDKNINLMMAKDDTDSVQKLLLDISGISANIGADRLANVSTEFREILKNKQENKFFEIEERFKDTLLQVKSSIETYMH
ncbi:response regulator [Sulfurimonas sp. HSL-1716]|uniref:response regulator n=1 Tax=Hydrocurvibacter sulfurireducens TaxID=3131937 RepID=UPI0031F8E8BC